MSDDEKIFTEREMVIEVRLARIEESVEQLRQSMARMEELLNAQAKGYAKEVDKLREQVDELKRTKIYALGWIGAIAFFVTLFTEKIKHIFGM